MEPGRRSHWKNSSAHRSSPVQQILIHQHVRCLCSPARPASAVKQELIFPVYSCLLCLLVGCLPLSLSVVLCQFPFSTLFTRSAASLNSIAENTFSPDSSISFFARSALVPCKRTITGT